MPSPLVKITDRPVWLAPQYFGSIAYYAALASHAKAVIDTALRYDKRRKSVHRCQIIDTRDRLTLTVPVSRPRHGSCTGWGQVTVSAQADWWSDHRVSLESAYGRTPYFEHYIDRLLPWISADAPGMRIVDLDARLDEQVRLIMGLDTEVSCADLSDAGLSGFDPAAVDDLRRGPDPEYPAVPYYQVRSDKFGFVPDLSILDLIFNMGPEAPLVLHAMTSATNKTNVRQCELT